MKKHSKLLLVLLTLMLIVSMAACGGGGGGDEVDYSTMQQGEEPIIIYEGTSMDAGEIGSVMPTKEMLKEVDALFSGDGDSPTYAQIVEIMGCHGLMRPEDDGDFEYIAYDWEHPDTDVSIVVTFHVQEDGTYRMNAHSTFPPGILSE